MKKLLLILICLFVSFEVRSVSSTKHEWTKTHEFDVVDFYLDLKNIESRNNFVYWYQLLNSKEDEKWSDTNEPLPKSHIYYKKGDCGDMKYKDLNIFEYQEPMGKEYVRSFPPSKLNEKGKFVEDKKWKFPRPGSSGEYELKLVCEISSKKNSKEN